MIDHKLLKKHIDDYVQKLHNDEGKLQKDLAERNERIDYFQSQDEKAIMAMEKEDFSEYISKLWATLIWGNKEHLVNKIIEQNESFDYVKEKLADFVWGKRPLKVRWDDFNTEVKGFGPAMMSEILCMVYPEEYMVWNRRAFVALNYLGAKDLPRYNYQCTGNKYLELCEAAKKIAEELKKAGLKQADLVMVDFFIWEELQVVDNLSKIHITPITESTEDVIESAPGSEHIEREKQYEFIHDEIRDKVSDIGEWLGFTSKTEAKVAEGAVVDAVWEATIGNMGRVIYVFEVQSKGSIDGLILNLLKSLNNPAVQGVVAVSDEVQLKKIKRHASEVGQISDKLKYWDYREVLDNYEHLAIVNESINKLDLVPKGF